MKTKHKGFKSEWQKDPRVAQIIIGNTPLAVDWRDLQEQRSGLTDEGLRSFFDAFCDAAAGVLGEEVVFGRKLS